MKKTFLLIAACTMCILAQAQVLKIVSMQQISTPSNMEGKVVGISPKGDYLLLTDLSNTGLVRYELASKTATTITDAEGAGWDVKISQDGNKITYRQRHDNNQLIRHDIMQYNIADGKAIVRQQAQRGTAQLVAADANTTVSVNEDLHLVLTQNGKSIILTPNGAEQAYNWPSISPDGSKILYYVSGVGCYVCDLNGKNSQFIGYDCRAPRWYDNNTIVGMYDIDDDHFTVSSRIVAYTLDGKYQILTSPEMIAMYPFATEGKIVFSTIDSKTYIINVNK
jgi:Tol biopolymer transport system component